mgnify:CR=1 FL=1
MAHIPGNEKWWIIRLQKYQNWDAQLCLNYTLSQELTWGLKWLWCLSLRMPYIMLNFHHADESYLSHCRPITVINTSISRKCHILLYIVQTNEKSLWKLMIVTRVVPPCLTSRQLCIWRHIRQPEPKAHSWISNWFDK